MLNCFVNQQWYTNVKDKKERTTDETKLKKTTEAFKSIYLENGFTEGSKNSY